MKEKLLSVTDITKSFGGLRALDHVTFSVSEGETVGLIGPNGAGKTTLLNVITGVYPPTSGAVRFQDRDITGLRPYRIARLGIARTFQAPAFLPGTTSARNLELSRLFRIWPRAFWREWIRREEWRAFAADAAQLAREVLQQLQMEQLAEEDPANLSYGQKKLVSLGMSLALRPRLLLLDEPAAGLTDEEIDRLIALLRATQSAGITLIVVEHRLKLIMKLCQKIVVLNYGRKLAEGTPEEIRNNPDVQDAYLGQQEMR